MDKNKKSLIVAERIQLRFVSELIEFIVVSAFLGGFLWLAIYFKSILWIILCGLIFAIFALCGVYYLIKIFFNNRSPSVLITYKDDVFTICDEADPLTFTKDELFDVDYKTKKSFVATPYFYTSKEWNYGTLTLFLKNKEATNKSSK